MRCILNCTTNWRSKSIRSILVVVGYRMTKRKYIKEAGYVKEAVCQVVAGG